MLHYAPPVRPPSKPVQQPFPPASPSGEGYAAPPPGAPGYSMGEDVTIKSTIDELKSATFDSKKAAVEAVQLACHARGKALKQWYSSQKCTKLKCEANMPGFHLRMGTRRSPVKEVFFPCNAFADIRRRKVKGKQLFTWHVKDMALDHDMGCPITAKPKINLLEQMSCIKNTIEAQPTIKAKELMRVALSQGIHLTHAQAHKLKGRYLTGVKAAYPESFGYLRPTLEALEKLNEGFLYELHTDENGAFIRCAWIIPTVVDCICHGGLGITALDGAHSRHPTYDGTLLCLVGKDGDNRNIPLAWALVPSESKENYMWFLTLCAKGPLREHLNDCTLFSDQDKGLKAAYRELAINELETSQDVVQQPFLDGDGHLYCTKHLIRTLRSRKDVANSFTDGMIWGIQASKTLSDYERNMAILKACSAGAEAYLRKLPPASWVVFAYIANGKKTYGMRTNNLVEQENSRVREIRARAPVDVIAETTYLTATILLACEERAIKMNNEDNFLTVYATRMYKEQQQLASHVQIQPTGTADRICNSTCYATSLGQAGMARKYLVNILESTCECTFWQDHGIPCRHAIQFYQQQLWKTVPAFADPEGWLQYAVAPEYWTGTYVVTYDGTAGKIKVPQRLNMALDGTVKKPLGEEAPQEGSQVHQTEKEQGRRGWTSATASAALCRVTVIAITRTRIVFASSTRVLAFLVQRNID